MLFDEQGETHVGSASALKMAYAAAETFDRLAVFKNAEPDSVYQVIDALLGRGAAALSERTC
ncbi:hypothetical protein [Candidatus Poriferisodalis sp.]|uniref:hypothetical protein n=1 Tax=Candidatus Poriferisodalis sp. TaxID=3101277 RepID=UPI003B02B51D